MLEPVNFTGYRLIRRTLQHRRQISTELTKMDGEGSPLLTAGMKCTILNMKISCAHCLRSESIKQCHSWPWLDAHWNMNCAIVSTMYKIACIIIIVRCKSFLSCFYEALNWAQQTLNQTSLVSRNQPHKKLQTHLLYSSSKNKHVVARWFNTPLYKTEAPVILLFYVKVFWEITSPIPLSKCFK